MIKIVSLIGPAAAQLATNQSAFNLTSELQGKIDELTQHIEQLSVNLTKEEEAEISKSLNSTNEATLEGKAVLEIRHMQTVLAWLGKILLSISTIWNLPTFIMMVCPKSTRSDYIKNLDKLSWNRDLLSVANNAIWTIYALKCMTRDLVLIQLGILAVSVVCILIHCILRPETIKIVQLISLIFFCQLLKTEISTPSLCGVFGLQTAFILHLLPLSHFVSIFLILTF